MTHKLLVVDDSWESRNLLASYLRTGGYEVVEAEDGPEALQLAPSVDLILLDVVMAPVDGFEVCRQLRSMAETRNIPIVMVTALREREHWLTGIDAGADEFLTKPVDSLELLVRVRGLLRLKDQRDEAARLERDLAAMLVHDLKGPLTGIRGFAYLMAGEDDRVARESYHDRIGSAVDQLLGLVEDLLAVSRMAAGAAALEFSPVDLGLVVQDVVTQAAPRAAKRGLALSIDCPEGLGPLSGDGSGLRRLVGNLVDNALKFAAREVGIRVTPAGGDLVVRVEDDGPGFGPDEVQVLFERWYQAKEGRASGLGAGLGLSIVKMLAAAHGGHVTAANRPGGGAAFEVVLPAGPGAANPAPGAWSTT